MSSDYGYNMGGCVCGRALPLCNWLAKADIPAEKGEEREQPTLQITLRRKGFHPNIIGPRCLRPLAHPLANVA